MLNLVLEFKFPIRNSVLTVRKSRTFAVLITGRIDQHSEEVLSRYSGAQFYFLVKRHYLGQYTKSDEHYDGVEKMLYTSVFTER